MPKSPPKKLLLLLPPPLCRKLLPKTQAQFLSLPFWLWVVLLWGRPAFIISVKQYKRGLSLWLQKIRKALRALLFPASPLLKFRRGKKGSGEWNNFLLKVFKQCIPTMCNRCIRNRDIFFSSMIGAVGALLGVVGCGIKIQKLDYFFNRARLLRLVKGGYRK